MPPRAGSTRPAPLPGERVVTCLGETMAVLAPAPPGPLDQAELLALNAGGAESNVAQYLAGHGVTARWVSRVGADPFGRMICRRINASGVDVSGVHVDSQRPTGVYFKERGRVHYYRHGSAASALSPAVLDTPAVATADALHVTGITPALSESCRELVTVALEPGPRRRPLVSFDLNWRPALWPPGDGADLLRRLANLADVVFVGQDEATSVWGCRGAGAIRVLLPDPPVLVVKDAEHGATAFHAGAATIVPSLTVDIVDVVGAGDAFAAGFLAALFAGQDPVGQLRLGHLTAAAALRSAADHGPLLDPAIVQPLLTADAEVWSAATIPVLDTV